MATRAVPTRPTPDRGGGRPPLVVRSLSAVALAAVAWAIAWSLPIKSPCWRVATVDWGFRQKAFSELSLHETDEVYTQSRRDGTPMEEAYRRRWEEARTPEEKRLASMPIQDFIAASTALRLTRVAGAEWELFFQTIEDALDRRTLPPHWSRTVANRLLKNSTFHSLFLPVSEKPLPALPPDAGDGRPWYLQLDSGDDRYLEIEWIAPDRDRDREIGPYDFATFWEVPEAYRWPLRHRAPWLAAAACIIPFVPIASRGLARLRDLPRPIAPSAGAEIFRRVGLFGLAALACCVAFWTHLEPYWIVRPIESKEAARRASVSLAMPLLMQTMPEATEDPGKAHQMAEEIFKKRDEDTEPALAVSGPEWKAFFVDALGVFRGGTFPEAWLHRINDGARRDIDRPPPFGEPTRVSRLTFWRDEAPLAAIATSVKMAETYRLRLRGGGDPELFASLHPAPEIAAFGAPSFGIPDAMAYPLRPAWPWLVALGLLCYILPPRRKIGPDTVAWPTWRLIFSDFATALLFLPFFGLPLMIVGSTQAALTYLLPFTAVFWILAALGAYLIPWVIHYACWSIDLLPDGIVIHTVTLNRPIAFSEIAAIQRAELKPPKWLVVLSFLAALLPSRGSARAGQTGRAMLLASSSSYGLILRLKNGPSPILWFTDQMGSVAVRNFKRLTDALEQRQIPQVEDVVELRRITPPDQIDAPPPRPARD